VNPRGAVLQHPRSAAAATVAIAAIAAAATAAAIEVVAGGGGARGGLFSSFILFWKTDNSHIVHSYGGNNCSITALAKLVVKEKHMRAL
jgi:hypothetical protein